MTTSADDYNSLMSELEVINFENDDFFSLKPKAFHNWFATKRNGYDHGYMIMIK
jgi:hypothetical protein